MWVVLKVTLKTASRVKREVPKPKYLGSGLVISSNVPTAWIGWEGVKMGMYARVLTFMYNKLFGISVS